MPAYNQGNFGDENMARWQPFSYPALGDTKFLYSYVNSPSEVFYTVPDGYYFYIFSAEENTISGGGDHHRLIVRNSTPIEMYCIFSNYPDTGRPMSSHVSYFFPLVLKTGDNLYHYSSGSGTGQVYSVFGIESKIQLAMR